MNRIDISRRELEVLKLILRGFRNKQIANEFSLSVKTVENHVRSMMLKMQAQNRTDLVIKAIQQGIITIGDNKHD